jgi:hypothetical protein
MQTALRLSLCQEKSLSKDRFSLRQSSLDVAWLFTSAQKESNRVTSMTEAMYIPARSMTTDPSMIDDYNAGHNGNIISFCDSFQY